MNLIKYEVWHYLPCCSSLPLKKTQKKPNTTASFPCPKSQNRSSSLLTDQKTELPHFPQQAMPWVRLAANLRFETLPVSLSQRKQTSGCASQIVDRRTDNSVTLRRPENRCWTGKTAQRDSGFPGTIVVPQGWKKQAVQQENNKNKWWRTRGCVCCLWESVRSLVPDLCQQMRLRGTAWDCAWRLCGRAGLELRRP